MFSSPFLSKLKCKQLKLDAAKDNHRSYDITYDFMYVQIYPDSQGLLLDKLQQLQKSYLFYQHGIRKSVNQGILLTLQ